MNPSSPAQCETAPPLLTPPQADAAGVTSRPHILYFDILRVLAIVAVVCTHVSDKYGLLRIKNLSETDWWLGITYFTLSRFCVPVFLMISGALLLNPRRQESIGAFYIKRLPKILIPLILWKLIYFYYLPHAPNYKFTMVLQFIFTQNNHHFWFMYLIFGLYLAAPFIKRMVNGAKPGVIIAYLSLVLVFCIIVPFLRINCGIQLLPFSYNTIFNPYVAYFVMGFALEHLTRPVGRKLSLIIFLPAYLLISLLTIVAIYLIRHKTGIFAGTLIDYNQLNIILMSVAMFLLVKGMDFKISKDALTARILKSVGLCAYGIYLVHILVLHEINRIYQTIGMGWILKYPATLIPAQLLGTVMISLALVWVLRKIPVVKILAP